MQGFVSKLIAQGGELAAELRYWLLPAKAQVRDFPFTKAQVDQLHLLTSDAAAGVIDDATWKDLLLEPYCAELAREVSIFGQQKLNQRLRIGGDQGMQERIQELIALPERVEQLRGQCMLLRHADTEIATLLYADARPPAPAWAGWILPLPLALLGAFAALAWSPIAWLAVFAVLFVLMSAQIRYAGRLAQWQRAVLALQVLLRVADQLGESDSAAIGAVRAGLKRSSLLPWFPGLESYLDWFAMGNVHHYNKTVKMVFDQRALLRTCFEQVANVEADLALARHLLRTPRFCWAARADSVALQEMAHPLLADAQPLTLDLRGRSVFVSGRNGIGKSTLLRTLGINLIVARAFGFCYAASASAPMTPVYASMQSEDSLMGGESLYQAELRRATELLAAADGPHPGVCIIDEIFRGTNHAESVSAAASVLDALAARSLVVVSSHNLVLAPLLAHRFAPWCVERIDGAHLTLAPGVLAHTNGIALLAERGFSAGVQQRAGAVFDWLSSYLAHPGECNVLQDAP